MREIADIHRWRSGELHAEDHVSARRDRVSLMVDCERETVQINIISFLSGTIERTILMKFEEARELGLVLAAYAGNGEEETPQ